ncbi:MAG: hypothetical protein ACPG7E_06770 [Marinirhabdus sp.]
MKIQLVVLLCIVCSAFVSTKNEKIGWKEKPKLQWSDFKGTPPAGTGFVASTSSGISFSFSYKSGPNGTELNYEVYANFYPYRSWVVAGNDTGYILRHEQAHFDITEIFARKFRKKLAATNFTGPAKSKIETMYREMEEERVYFQKLFDSETDHSRIPEQEILWERKIATMLKQLDAWK